MCYLEFWRQSLILSLYPLLWAGTAQAHARWSLHVFSLPSAQGPTGEDSDAVLLALAGHCLPALEIGLVALPPLFTCLSQRDCEGFLHVGPLKPTLPTAHAQPQVLNNRGTLRPGYLSPSPQGPSSRTTREALSLRLGTLPKPTPSKPRRGPLLLF